MFQNEFWELQNKFKENEKIIQKLAMSGSTLDAVNEELDELETVTKALSVDVLKAKRLQKTGNELLLEHAFARRSLEPSCVELRNMCKKQKIMFLEKRGSLMKFLDLYEGIEELSSWTISVTAHLDRDKNGEEEISLLDQYEEVKYLLAAQREMIIGSRPDFEDNFYGIKDLIDAKTLVSVDRKLTEFAEVKKRIVEKRNLLREQVGDDPNISTNCDKSGKVVG